ncbi:MAG: hypothetical protein HN704_03600 [Bacteroidetes bacterium]|jgi:hypothetical protein|nr:hypothetical protein [Bacteroidota bacterium]MBT6686695.1 hypothetical protein [Bacteroidota bacterium]MBT7141833.1 hypothetical protein [Bacteroidota bacterium]MBT7490676.1 hypothetical protein [Bacteroidota bacterium]
MQKKSIVKIISFILILLIANVFMDFAYKAFCNSQRYVSKKDALFESLNSPPKYLLIGDSHVQNAVNPQIFKSSFNYSSPNENYIQTYYRLKFLIENRINIPEKIILPLDLSSFTYFRSERFKYDSYWIKYIDYFELNNVKKESNKNNNNKYIKKWVGAKFFSYAGQFDFLTTLILAKESKFSEEYLGYKPRYADFSNKMHNLKKIKDRVRLYFPDNRIFDADLAMYFEKILKICEENNIELLLFRMPLTQQYYNGVADIFDIDNYYAKIIEITKKYDNVVEVPDYQKVFFEHPEYFRNPDHMNHTGASIFSEMLNKRFNK